MTRPVSADPPPERAVRRRVGDVGAAAEHGDRAAAGVEGAAVGAGVDPEGEAADDDHPGGGQLPAELARDLAPVGGGAARADDRHRRRRARARRAGPGRRGRSAPRARRPRRAAPPGRASPWRQQAQQPPSSSSPSRWPRQRLDPAQQLRRHLRRRRLDAGPRWRAAAVPASASRPRRSHFARGRGRAGRAARSGAGTRGRRAVQLTVPPPQLQRLRHLLLADRLGAARGRRSSAPAAAPGRGRGR